MLSSRTAWLRRGPCPPWLRCASTRRPPGIELFHRLQLLPDLAVPPREFLGGEIDDAAVATFGGERLFAGGPCPAGRPQRRLEHDLAVAIARNGCLGTLEAAAPAML